MTARIKRVLLVVPAVGVGGMELYCLSVAREFIRRGLDVSVVLTSGAVFDDLAAQFETSGAHVSRIQLFPTHGRWAQARGLAAYARALRAARADVVHIHLGGAESGLASVLGARLFTGAPVVVTEHDAPDASPVGPYHRLTRRFLDRLVHVLIACSRKNAAIRRTRLGVWTPASRFAVVPIGIDTAPIPTAERTANRARIRQQFRIGQDEPVVGCVVRFAGNKGLNDLLDAFALLEAPPALPIHLLLVGDGELRHQLERRSAAMDDRHRVHFAGFQWAPRPFFHAMDIFALAVPEGTGSLALMEAMQDGLPAVITFGGPEEAVIDGETGFWAKPHNPVDLAAKLQRLLDDPRIRSVFGERAAAEVAAKWTTVRVADDLLLIYRDAKAARLPDRLVADGIASRSSRELAPLPAAPSRVFIVGVSGSGKTTLARKLSGPLGLTHLELDTIAGVQGWDRELRPKAPVESRVRELGAFLQRHPRWVIDGGLWWTAEATDLADLVIWLDVPRRMAFWRVARRNLAGYIRDVRRTQGRARLDAIRKPHVRPLCHLGRKMLTSYVRPRTPGQHGEPPHGDYDEYSAHSVRLLMAKHPGKCVRLTASAVPSFEERLLRGELGSYGPREPLVPSAGTR